MPHLTETDIQQAFIKAVNKALYNKGIILDVYKETIHMLTDKTELEKERAGLQNECDVVTELLNRHINEYARNALQAEYQRQYSALSERYSEAHGKLLEVEATILARSAKRADIRRVIRKLEMQDTLITEFDEDLWYVTVDKVTVVKHDELRFTLRDGSRVSVGI